MVQEGTSLLKHAQHTPSYTVIGNSKPQILFFEHNCSQKTGHNGTSAHKDTKQSRALSKSHACDPVLVCYDLLTSLPLFFTHSSTYKTDKQHC